MESAAVNNIADRARVLTFFFIFLRICHMAPNQKLGHGQGINQEQKSKATGGGARATSGERVHVVGFTGTGYQRSLPLNESDAYNF